MQGLGDPNQPQLRVYQPVFGGSFFPYAMNATNIPQPAPILPTPRTRNVCMVCGGEAESFHLNYGVNACFSCRAFFRRSVLKPFSPRLWCKKGGTCRVTFETRRNCPGCRFRKCFEAGMNPHAVMDESTKKVRFKKALQRVEAIEGKPGDRLKFYRKNRNSNNHPGEGTSSEMSAENMETATVNIPETNVTENRPVDLDPSAETRSSNHAGYFDIDDLVEPAAQRLEELEESSVSMFEQYSNKSLEQLNTPSPAPEETYSPYACLDVESATEQLFFQNESDLPFRRQMFHFASHIRTTWQKACNKMQVDAEFKENLVSFHLGYGSLSKDLLKRHMITLGRLLRDFALDQPDFVTLTINDQKRLLSRNTLLFIQYILARYITASSGREQLTWLLVSQTHCEEGLHRQLRRISFGTLDRTIGLFPSKSANVRRYESLAQELKDSLVHFKFNSLIALTCLYNNSSSFFDNPIRIDGFLNDVFLFADWFHEVFIDGPDKSMLSSIILKSEELGSIFEESIDWDVAREIRYELRREITLFHTSEEDQWLNAKLEEYTCMFHSVSIGEETLREMIMLSFDVPLSKTFMNRLNSANVERCRRIQMTHDAVRNLGFLEQMKLLMSNFGTFMTLFSLRSVTLPSGYQQIKFNTGTKDHLIIKEKYHEVSNNGSKIKKISLDAANKISGGHLISNEASKKFEKVAANLSHFVQDLISYKLLSLIVALDTSWISNPNPSLVQLQDMYKRHLFRRLNHKFTNYEINKLFDDLKELSNVLKLYIEKSLEKPEEASTSEGK